VKGLAIDMRVKNERKAVIDLLEKERKRGEAQALNHKDGAKGLLWMNLSSYLGHHH
jgi:hypothetical protein